MTTCLDIIRRAVLSAEGDRDVPAGDDGRLAMMRLQDVILGLPQLMNGPWREVDAREAASVTAADGDRVRAGAQTVVTFPDAAGADLCRVQVLGEGPQTGIWVRAASLGAWRRADGLSLADDSPFGPEDDAGLSAILALSLAADAGVPATVETAALAMAAMTRFSARFHREQPQGAPDALLRGARMGWGMS